METKVGNKKARWIWLSHVLDEKTPAYAGGDGLKIIQDKQIRLKDSCNTSRLELPCHLGSHVDAPLHFIADGKSVEQYGPEDWIFNRPVVLDCSPMGMNTLVHKDHIKHAIEKIEDLDHAADFIFFYTGFSQYRDQSIYWQNGPGISLEASQMICQLFPNLKAIGMDSISISSLAHRNEGRQAHLFVLKKGIRIFEDLTLSCLGKSEKLIQLIAMPLRFLEANGAPCSVLGLASNMFE